MSAARRVTVSARWARILGGPASSATFWPCPSRSASSASAVGRSSRSPRNILISRWVDLVLTPDLLGPDQSFERTATRPDGASTSRTWPTEIIAVIQAPLVCGGRTDGCNGGWMSRLDGQVRHLLEPMMLGNPRMLAPEEQQTIATWCRHEVDGPGICLGG